MSSKKKTEATRRKFEENPAFVLKDCVEELGVEVDQTIEDAIEYCDEVVKEYNPDEQITKNFTLGELSCPCCNEFVWDEPSVEALQKLRDAFGEPIAVNSGYRCAEHNEEVGGVSNSYHLTGKAFDIRATNTPGTQGTKVLFEMAAQFFNGRRLYQNDGRIFTHVDTRGTKWTQVN